MLDVYPSALKKPSGFVNRELPNQFKRPAFGELYGFDVPEGTGTLLAEPGLYADIVVTTPTNYTIRYATDIQATMVYESPDWHVYYSVHNYNFLVTNWEDFSTRTWDNMT
jgi:hypothetical protein